MSDSHEQIKLSLSLEPSNKESASQPKQKERDPMPEQKPVTDFESMLKQLEQIVNQLEGELKLEEALGLFEKGLVLSQDCQKFLKEAQKRVEILKRSSTGALEKEPYSEEAAASLS